MALDGVKLHMVFTGRGDSFVPEVTDGMGNRKLVLIDGGPAGRRHGTTGAPYSRYLMAAIRRGWGNLGRVKGLTLSSFHCKLTTLNISGYSVNGREDSNPYGVAFLYFLPI
ncbi:hypothetical protein FBULB1_8688 [Fusarium bulbicola]|nr:hypothetical protein FBULB1_8688 [Fusarium bulbicola]